MNKGGRYVSLLLAVQLMTACSDNEAPAPAPEARPAADAGKAARTAPQTLVLAFGDSLYAGYGLEQG